MRRPTAQPQRVGGALKGVYRSMEYLQRELEKIYWLKMRLTSRLLMKSVKEERDQASANALKGAAPGARRLGTTRVRAKRTIRYYSIYSINIYKLYNRVVKMRHFEDAKVGGVDGSLVRTARL